MVAAIIVLTVLAILLLSNIGIAIYKFRKKFRIVKNDGYEVQELYKGSWIIVKTCKTEEEAEAFLKLYLNDPRVL